MSDNNMAQKVALLNEYGQALRNDWSDFDGRSAKLTLDEFVEWVLDDSKPFDVLKGREILNVCPSCGDFWWGDCWNCEGDTE